MASCRFLFNANTVAEIEAVLAWAKEAQLKIVLVGGQNAWRLAPQLKESDTPVIITLSTTPHPGATTAMMHLRQRREVTRGGVRFCMAMNGRNSEAPHERNLPYEASMASAFGLPKDEASSRYALSAQLLGIDDQLGSVQPGKAATLIITTGDPLDFPRKLRRLYRWTEGRPRHRQTRLRDKYKEKYRRK